jgi:hypothetical protein
MNSRKRPTASDFAFASISLHFLQSSLQILAQTATGRYRRVDDDVITANA